MRKFLTALLTLLTVLCISFGVSACKEVQDSSSVDSATVQTVEYVSGLSEIEITQVTYLDKVVNYKIREEENGKTYKYVPQILCQEDELTIQVRYEITPTDATNKSVSYSFDPSGYVIEENGYIVFTRPTSGVKQVGVWITLSPVDNKTISDTIYVSVKFV